MQVGITWCDKTILFFSSPLNLRRHVEAEGWYDIVLIPGRCNISGR